MRGDCEGESREQPGRNGCQLSAQNQFHLNVLSRRQLGIHLFMEIERPCFLVIDREYSGSISSRKLVIETAKFNVLTAYSAGEGIRTLMRFPAVDGVVMNADMHDMGCDELIATLKQIVPKVPVVVVGRARDSDCHQANHTVETFEPDRLLTVLRKLCSDQAKAIEKRNEELEGQE